MCIYVPTKGRKINFKMLNMFVSGVVMVWRLRNWVERHFILYSYFYNGNIFMCYYVINKIKAKKKH